MISTMADAWPLFALRLRTERLVLRLPTDDDLLALLRVARGGIHPPDEMPFTVPWSVRPSPAFEQGFLQYHWLCRAQWDPGSWALNLMVELDGQPVGSLALRGPAWLVHRTVDTGTWLGQPWQGRGLGKEMRTAGLALAFDHLGARVALSSAFRENTRSNGVSRALGYEENGIGALAPFGVSRETQEYRMTLDGWRARPRPVVVVEGLDRCRTMFG